MPSIVLTDLTIRSLKAERRADYWDAKTPSFGVRVGKRSKIFVAKVQNRRITIGAYPAISLADARRKALALKSENAPVPVATVTFEHAYEKFKEAHCSRKRARTQHDYKRVLEKHFLPHLRATRLSNITPQKLASLTDPLLPTPSEYAHALGVARTFFKWCIRPPHRFLTHSPLEGLQISVGESRTRVLNDIELKTVWNAAIEQGYPHGAAIRLLILTGQRRGEIASLRWPWINERDQTITLPASITKNNTEHTFPYGLMVADILETIPRLNSTDLLFPARGNEQYAISGWSKFKQEMTDGVAGWTLHDLRRTFATNLAALGTPIHVTEKLLNHISGTQSGIVGVYQRHSYAPEMREAIEKWEKCLTALLAQTSQARAA